LIGNASARLRVVLVDAVETGAGALAAFAPGCAEF
jgi:hypothetical protein